MISYLDLSRLNVFHLCRECRISLRLVVHGDMRKASDVCPSHHHVVLADANFVLSVPIRHARIFRNGILVG